MAFTTSARIITSYTKYFHELLQINDITGAKITFLLEIQLINKHILTVHEMEMERLLRNILYSGIVCMQIERV